MSQLELNHLLNLEEDAYFESRRWVSERSDLSQRFKPTSPFDLIRILKPEQEAYFSSVSDGSRCGDASSAVARPTTLMVRNIAWKLSVEQLREHLRELGFEGTYDYLHLPTFRSGRANQGYFFVNFRQPVTAVRFKAQLQGKAFGDCTKLCDVAVAKWKGLQELRAGIVVKPKSKAGPLFL